ncbi:hypothetical protein J4475_03795 [Candidatus Woesearchaeota archaeon]|nr:hypothetical protein [Candidatus Woesearchaeota archaeon]
MQSAFLAEEGKFTRHEKDVRAGLAEALKKQEAIRAELRKKQSIVDDLERQLKKTKAELSQEEQKIAGMKADYGKKNQAVLEDEKRVKQLAKDIVKEQEQLHAQRKEHQAERDSFREEIKKAREDLGKMGPMLAAKERHLRSLEKQEEELNETIRSLHGHAERQKQEIGRLAEKSNFIEKHVRERAELLARKEGELTHVMQQLKEAGKDAAKTKSQWESNVLRRTREIKELIEGKLDDAKEQTRHHNLGEAAQLYDEISGLYEKLSHKDKSDVHKRIFALKEEIELEARA